MVSCGVGLRCSWGGKGTSIPEYDATPRCPNMRHLDTRICDTSMPEYATPRCPNFCNEGEPHVHVFKNESDLLISGLIALIYIYMLQEFERQWNTCLLFRQRRPPSSPLWLLVRVLSARKREVFLKVPRAPVLLNLLAPELFNFITPCALMWIIQEPNTLELWNKVHFEEEKKESIYHV